MIKAVYSFLVAPLGIAGYRLFALGDRKARGFFAIRKGMFEELRKNDLPAGRTRVLFHVASVGELLQAMPVMEALANEQDPPAVVLSFTSPSVTKNMPNNVRAHLVTPSPLELTSSIRRFMDEIEPDLLVFSTYDVWPGMLMEAAERGVPALLINAALPGSAGRLRFPARAFHAKIYSLLSAAGAIAPEHAHRLARLGLAPGKVRVTGNCRFDQTLSRCRAVSRDDPDVSILPGFETFIVAGSTWPQDHKHLLPALGRLLRAHQDLAAVIAPHEPGQDHVQEVEEFFKRAGIGVVRYSSLARGSERGHGRVVVVDRLGVLYKLYKRASAAYVGGSFHQGVHNVMEPAGMGAPVVVGPVHKNSAEALDMIRAGGIKVAGTDKEIESAFNEWINQPEKLKTAGEAAVKVVEQNAGATSRTAALIKEFMDSSG